MIRQIKSKQFKLYAKPKYKSGWRNYQVDLTKPAFKDFALDYTVIMDNGLSFYARPIMSTLFTRTVAIEKW